MPRSPSAWLRRRSLVVTQEDGDLQIGLQTFVTHIGRGIGAHVRLDDHAVSRRHAMILADPTTVTIHDNRSANGVFVNGQRVSEMQLRDGDVIMLGQTTLHYLSAITLPVWEPSSSAPSLWR